MRAGHPRSTLATSSQFPPAPEPSKPLTHGLTHPSTEGNEKAAAPRALPQALFEVCLKLEERGISTWSQGEGLLDDLRPPNSAPPTTTEPRSTRSLLCQANSRELLEILPRAVVTASQARRLTLATEVGPIDLLPIGRGTLEEGLLAFGLSPFAFAYRPTEECWCDPADARATFDAGFLDISVAAPNPFDLAPRRYWIAARLMSERSLEPSARLLEAAHAALPGAIDRLPQAAPARREVSRILASSAPERGLAFLPAELMPSHLRCIVQVGFRQSSIEIQRFPGRRQTTCLRLLWRNQTGLCLIPAQFGQSHERQGVVGIKLHDFQVILSRQHHILRCEALDMKLAF